jgi:hypothetical protein
MTASIHHRILGPVPFWYGSGHPLLTVGNATLDASNDGTGAVFRASDENAITHLGFRYHQRVGTPPTYIIGLEGVSTTTGLPDGTYVGGGSPASGTFTPPADTTWDATWQWVALSNAYTPSRNEVLALTIRHSSGSVDGSNHGIFTRADSNFNLNQPYALALTAGTWALSANAPVFGVRTASSRYGSIIKGVYSTRSASTAGHRQAMAFTLPSGHGDTFKVRGMRFYGSLAAAGGKTPLFELWDGSGVLSSGTNSVDADINSSVSTSVRSHELYLAGTLPTLSYGTKYYIGLEVVDAVNAGVQLGGIQLASADDLAAFPGGSNVHLATFDGSSWTDDTTVRPAAELILEDITEPAGGSGAINPLNGMIVA